MTLRHYYDPPMMRSRMSAQEKWKIAYWRWLELGADISFSTMQRYRREAALERKLDAAQRTIEAQALRIEELEIRTPGYDDRQDDPGNEWEKEYYLRGMHR